MSETSAPLFVAKARAAFGSVFGWASRPMVAISILLAQFDPAKGVKVMSVGTILIVLLIIFLLGGFSGRLGGYGYGFGHGGVSALGVVLIIVIVLVLTGRM